MATNPGPLNTYTYYPLEEDEIRLLKLYPGKWDSDLTGTLETYRLLLDENVVGSQPDGMRRDTLPALQIDSERKSNIAPDYEALSYLWGEGPFVTSITIFVQDIPYYLPIKANLHEALQEFRAGILDNTDPNMFWIDAICINQGHAPKLKQEFSVRTKRVPDEERQAQFQAEMDRRAKLKKEADIEKSGQIKKMADIYKQAVNVRVWLGKQDKNSTVAIEFIKRFLDLDDLDKLARHPASDVEWDAFRGLMQRPWFRRRWIVQEIAFARFATVHCGSSWIPWSDFSTAVSLFSIKHMDLNLLFQQSAKFANNPDYLGEVDALGAKILVETINALFRKSEDGEVIEHRLPLEALMSTLTAFDASYPHDTVYAILRLSYDTTPGPKLSAASLPQVAHHYAGSPLISPQSPAEPVGSRFSLDGSISEEPGELGPPSRTGTQSSIGSQIDRTASTGYLLTVPGQPDINQRRRPRANSRVQGAENKKNAEINPETGAGEEAKLITVDYEKSVFDLCRDFLDHVIGRSRSLDIICVPWAPSPEDGQSKMPSWIQHVSGRPYGLKFRSSDSGHGHTTVGLDQVYSRTAADPLVGTPGTGYQNYSACGKTRSYRGARPAPGQPQQLIWGRSLITCGFVLDVISDVEPQAMDAVIPNSWLERAGWADVSDPVPDRFWRTLVADRAADGPKNPAPGYFKLACKWAFSRAPGGNLNTRDLLTNFHGQCPSIAVTFLRRVQAVVWNRRLFLSKGVEDNEDSWLLGLAPATAKEGDLICILYGCSVPVVLRKKPKEEHSKPKRRKTMPPERRPMFATSAGRPVMTVTTKVISNPERSRRATAEIPEIPTERFATPVGSPPSSAGSSKGSQPPIDVTGLSMLDEYEPLSQSRNGSVPDSSGTSTPRLSSVSSIDKEYTLIGECYVHGMMDGDGFRHQIETGHKLQEFWLV